MQHSSFSAAIALEPLVGFGFFLVGFVTMFYGVGFFALHPTPTQEAHGIPFCPGHHL